jgi:hypothetical protein
MTECNHQQSGRNKSRAKNRAVLASSVSDALVAESPASGTDEGYIWGKHVKSASRDAAGMKHLLSPPMGSSRCWARRASRLATWVRNTLDRGLSHCTPSILNLHPFMNGHCSLWIAGYIPKDCLATGAPDLSLCEDCQKLRIFRGTASVKPTSSCAVLLRQGRAEVQHFLFTYTSLLGNSAKPGTRANRKFPLRDDVTARISKFKSPSTVFMRLLLNHCSTTLALQLQIQWQLGRDLSSQAKRIPAQSQCMARRCILRSTAESVECGNLLVCISTVALPERHRKLNPLNRFSWNDAYTDFEESLW